MIRVSILGEAFACVSFLATMIILLIFGQAAMPHQHGPYDEAVHEDSKILPQ